jgi:hypothetical protein
MPLEYPVARESDGGRIKMRLAVSLVASVIAFATWHDSGANAPAPTTQSVQFTFAWSAGMRVPVRMIFTQRYPDRPPRVARLRATLVVSKEELNLRVSFTDPKIETDVSDDDPLSVPGTLEQFKFLSLPDFLVSPDGLYVALAPVQHIQSALHDAFSNSGIKALSPDRIDHLTNAVAEVRARSVWNDWVSLWAGASVGPQTIYETKHKVTTAVPNTPSLVMHSLFQIIHYEPCQREKQQRRCVTISANEAPQPEDLTVWREQLFAKMPEAVRAEAESEMRSAKMEFSQTTQYVLEPEGLIPHSLTVIKRGDITGPRHGKQETSHIEWELRNEFDY